MTRNKFRSRNFGIVVFISFVWLTFVLLSFRISIGSSDHEETVVQLDLEANSEDYEAVQEKLVDFEDNDENVESTKWSTKYETWQLKPWSPVTYKPADVVGPGENGEGVIIPLHQKDLMEEMFEQNQYNLLAGNMISLNRSLPDERPLECAAKKYPELLPSTSIVIVFHNEAWTTLLRTIWSAINRTPTSLLEEIILVDDASERDYLGEQLEEYVKKLPKPVHVYRTGNRSGLIRARLLGAKHVKGEVITFLDAHCECTEGWLEPLLARIAENRETVVCPVIDTISDETFQYSPSSGVTWGGFNWKLNFRWYQIPPREMMRRQDLTGPIRTPTMAGGLLSIDREYFYKIGSYDEGMDIWGGENLEMSFRIWQCGGTLEIIPCSHVGHVFRNRSPYSFPGGTTKIIRHNLWRVANVWMDDWKYFYYIYGLGKSASLHSSDVSARKELRNSLNCKSFNWYLENIYPEAQMPFNYHYLGDIKSAQRNKCLDTLGKKENSELGMFTCHNEGGNQLFLYTESRQILNNDNCLSIQKNKLKMIRCALNSLNQKWDYNHEHQTFTHSLKDKCLESVKDSGGVALGDCFPNKTTQKWILDNPFKWQAPNHINYLSQRNVN